MIETNKLAMIDEAAAGKIQRRRKVDQYDAEIPSDGVLATRWTKELVAAQAEVGNEPDGVILLCGEDIVPEPVRWLWDGWLALGKLAILAGAPGTGKTTCALSMAATITTGGRWPDNSKSPLGDVLIWSGEDDPSDTLMPRLIASGVDRSRVHFIHAMREHGEERSFDPSKDTPALMEAARKLPELRFILLDPVANAVAGDSHNNTEVRRALQPLVDFAIQADSALLGITHFAKGGAGQDPTQRVIGSVAFSAVARVVLVCAKTKDEQGNDRRILARSKSNIGPDDGGFTYTLEKKEALPGIWTSHTAWGDVVIGSARDLLAEPNDGDEHKGPVEEAKNFLMQYLSNGTTPAKTVQAEAREAGISFATLRRASDKLGVLKRKGGMNSGWYWSLPKCEGAHLAAEDVEDVPFKKQSTFGTFGKEVSALGEHEALSKHLDDDDGEVF
jgi:putative DNA primase/helicase